MGIEIHGIFQKKVGDNWEDIESEYGKDRHSPLFVWLSGVMRDTGFETIKPISQDRGFPDDFNVDNQNYHPVSDRKYMTDQKLHKAEDPLRIWMGDYSHSWLYGHEILNTEKPCDDEFDYFLSEIDRLIDIHGEIRFVFGFSS